MLAHAKQIIPASTCFRANVSTFCSSEIGVREHNTDYRILITIDLLSIPSSWRPCRGSTTHIQAHSLKAFEAWMPFLGSKENLIQEEGNFILYAVQNHGQTLEDDKVRLVNYQAHVKREERIGITFFLSKKKKKNLQGTYRFH